jgi:hypothetical protein
VRAAVSSPWRAESEFSKKLYRKRSNAGDATAFDLPGPHNIRANSSRPGIVRDPAAYGE